MPFIFIGLVIALLVFVLLKWWANASTESAKKSLSGVVLAVMIALGIVLILGVVRGNFAFLPLLFVVAPIAWRARKQLRDGGGGFAARPTSNNAMTRKEALEVLGLRQGCSEDDIKAAYKRLMTKAHPDAGGSDWMAAKLNEAKNTLLNL